MHDARMPSPKSAYPQHQQPPPHYPHHPEGPPGGMDNGPPPPPPPQHMPQDSREHDRPPSVGPKRHREWEDEPAIKKPANDENRARLNDMHHRPSTPPRDPYRRNSSEARHQEQRRIDDARRAEDQRRAEDMRRAEEQRHANDGYHPSEAAHHPQNHSMPPNHLPPMQSGPSPMQGILHEGPPSGPPPKEYPADERQPMEHPPSARPPPINEPERAARKMDVDEDYDDSGEEEKKAGIVTNGSAPTSAAGELKTTTPTSASINGMMGPTPKVESS
jgi:general transcriptional corepressor CYC8